VARPPRSPFFKYRVIVAVVVSSLIAWITLSILTSVGITVYGAAAEQTGEGDRIAYVAGGDNTKPLKRCADGLRRMFTELRSRINGVAAEPVGKRAGERWQQCMSHYQRRLQDHRHRCRIGLEDPSGADPLLAELQGAAAGLDALATEYRRVHATMVDSLDEDFVALEGLFARVAARLSPHPR
jgi:hypothetical protein